MHRLMDDWTVEFHSGIPVYKQIVHHVQTAISLGQLSEGDQLPTIRAVHQKLNVNPNTVAKAYRELETAGLIQTDQGRGCFVAPGARAPKLLAKDKRAKMRELVVRFSAEAKGHGISFEELVQYLAKRESHV